MILPPKEWFRFRNDEEKLAYLKQHGLAAPTDTYARSFTYSGGYTDSPAPCSVIGFVDDYTTVISIGGEEHCIHPDHLLEMQAGLRSTAVPEEYVVLDLETTGINHNIDRIIEIAAVKYRNNLETHSFVTLVNPDCALLSSISDLTGITDSDLADAPTIDEILPHLRSFLGDSLIVAHNAPFDMSFLSDAFEDAGLPFKSKSIDTLQLARKAFPGLPSYKLQELKAYLRLDNQASHRALPDVYTTAALFLKCNEQLRLMQIEKKAGIGTTRERAQSSTASKGSQNGVISFKSQPQPTDISCTVESIDPNEPLFGKMIVFTGNMKMSRRDAMQAAVNCGAVLQKGVTTKTDYLVVGEQDNSIVGEDGLSSKQEKALRFNADGKANISIIDEAEFLSLVHMDEQINAAEENTAMENSFRQVLDPVMKEVIDENGVKESNFCIRSNKSYKSAVYCNSVVFSYKLSGLKYWVKFPVRYIPLLPSDWNQKKSARDGICRIDLDKPDDILAYTEVFRTALDVAIDEGPREFSCCSKYQTCSDAGKCVNENSDISEQCRYKVNLKHGKNFYKTH